MDLRNDNVCAGIQAARQHRGVDIRRKGIRMIMILILSVNCEHCVVPALPVRSWQVLLTRYSGRSRLPLGTIARVRRHSACFLYTPVFAALRRERTMSQTTETTPGTSPVERRQGDQPASAARKLNLLVVDDNQEVGESLAMLLEALGHHAVVVRNWQMAVEQVKLCVPDAVYLDIEMPGISGIEIGRRLHHNPETANAVLIAVTGHSLPMYMDDALAVGFRHFLVKPVRLDDLATTVQSVLAG
ncbi:response regulator [Janthinobacterium rivuli]|nr:response regulator [Janthinobacterium sp. FT68W]